MVNTHIGNFAEGSEKSIKIALLQIAPCKTLTENLEKGIKYCKKAKEAGADIALFPEMWSNGYNIFNQPVKKWKAEAISVDSDFINTFTKIEKPFIRSDYRE